MINTAAATETDSAFMGEALSLAALGRFTTAPNPNVGCVIVRDGNIVGRGWHAQAGTRHAEVHALREAGTRASGSTAYVTLEPCSHYGRTPPCADALIKANVARVVVAMQDPYYQVAGRGIERLRKHGIDVTVGVCEQAARELNLGFIKRAEKGLPFVRLKLAQSLDGRTALANGASQWITGAEARADVQVGRAMSGAILSGSATVLADNPRLNVRGDQVQALYPDGMEIRQPVRVLLDNQCQLSADLKLWQEPGPVWLVRPRASAQELPAHGQQLIVAQTAEGRLDLVALMEELARRDVNDVWCETGHRLGGALLQAGLVDELIVYTAPSLLGPDAQPLIDLPRFENLTQTPHFKFHSVERVGDDIKIVARLTDA